MTRLYDSFKNRIIAIFDKAAPAVCGTFIRHDTDTFIYRIRDLFLSQVRDMFVYDSFINRVRATFDKAASAEFVARPYVVTH